MDASTDQTPHQPSHEPSYQPADPPAERSDPRTEPGADTSRRPEPDAVDVYRGSGIMWSGIAVVVVMALLVIVAFQNTQDVTFDFLWLATSIPLILILAITFGIAVVTTETIGFVWRRRRRRQRRERDELRRLRRRG